MGEEANDMTVEVFFVREIDWIIQCVTDRYCYNGTTSQISGECYEYKIKYYRSVDLMFFIVRMDAH